MKINIKHTLISLLGVGIISLSSCNDDFMQQDPLNDLSTGKYFEKESDLPLYLNSLYKEYIIGYMEGNADGKTYPLDVQNAPLIAWDRISDNLVTTGNGSNRLTGTMTTPVSGESTGWSWKKLRSVNYFLTNYKKVYPSIGGKENEYKVAKYIAEAKFFKAMDYYEKMAFIGEVPWLVTDLNVTSEELYTAKRTPRVELTDSILACLDYAIANAVDQYNPAGRINKDMANFLKARVCLFEGSFREYHRELGLQSTAKALLEECVKSCEAIMNTGRYELYNGDERSYWKLFTFKGTTIPHKEAILARVYDGDKVGHSTQRYYEMNRARGTMGATRNAIDEYLCEDGRPIYTEGKAGSYTKNELFKGYRGADWGELDNRDPRLTQTIAKPGERNITTYNYVDNIKDGLLYYPTPAYTESQYQDVGSSITGYRVMKHWMGDYEERMAIRNGSQTAIVFRYAEVLLMLAEAKTILGTITQEDLDKTINKLRERAGYDFEKYPTARLKVSDSFSDPYLDEIYATKLDYPVSPLLREVRRERRVEMFQEATRYLDLMRWKAGNLLTVPLRGMSMKDRWKIYDGSLVDGKLNPETGIKEYAMKMTKGSNVFVDDTEDEFIIVYPKSSYIVNGVMPWDDRRYYFPIPLQELELNPNLTQNPGWEDIKR